MTVYFATTPATSSPETRPVPAGAGPLDAAMAALAAGPSGAGLIPALPPGTRVRSDRGARAAWRSSTSAPSFETGYPPGGSAAELAVVAPIVRTADRGGRDRPARRILVEGRAPAPPGAQLDLSAPLSPGGRSRRGR